MTDARALAGRLAEWIVDYASMGATLGDQVAEVERGLRHDFPEIDRLSAPEGVGLTRYSWAFSAPIEMVHGEWVRYADAAAVIAAEKARADASANYAEILHGRWLAAEAERDALKAALATFRKLVKEGGVPRYTVLPGAALNALVEEIDAALSKAQGGG